MSERDRCIRERMATGTAIQNAKRDMGKIPNSDLYAKPRSTCTQKCHIRACNVKVTATINGDPVDFRGNGNGTPVTHYSVRRPNIVISTQGKCLLPNEPNKT